jgi:hypothetical protein
VVVVPHNSRTTRRDASAVACEILRRRDAIVAKEVQSSSGRPREVHETVSGSGKKRTLAPPPRVVPCTICVIPDMGNGNNLLHNPVSPPHRSSTPSLLTISSLTFV